MKIKLICLLIIFSLLSACLIGCMPSETETTPTNKEEPSNSDVSEGQLAIVENGASKYQIVYPNHNSTLQALAEQLADQIQQKTGVRLPIVHDMDSKAEGDYEIRIGRVSRMDALKVYDALKDLSDWEYAVWVDSNQIYIYANQSEAVAEALGYFTETAMHVQRTSISVDADCQKLFTEPQETGLAVIEWDSSYVYCVVNPATNVAAGMCLSHTPYGWRIQTKGIDEEYYNNMGAAQRLAYSLGEEIPNEVEFIQVTKEGNITTATANDGSYVVIDQEPFSMSFYTASGKLASTITKIHSTRASSVVEGVIEPNEAIYGTGERFNAVNQRGKRINMFSVDTWSQASACYMVIPLLVFSRGSGVFLNHYEEMDLKLGDSAKEAETDTWRAEIYSETLDFYVFTTELMSEAIASYTDLSGHAEMPEEWSYGMLVCRISPDLSQKWSVDVVSLENHEGRNMGVYDTIAKMEEYDLPWSGLILEGWGPYNSSKHDDLKELCDYAHSLGKKVLVYMRVGTANDSMSGYSKEYMLSMTTPNGETTIKLPVAETNNPDTVNGADAYPYLDITNPDAVKWFFEEYWEYLSSDIGVDGCKIDFCETLPEYYELNYYDDSMPTAGSHHWYPTAFCAMFWEMISSKPDSGICFTRGGGIGSQRSPYMWAGDQMRKYECVEYQLKAILSSGMSGVPFMSYDMSGYHYGNETALREPYYEGQVFVRGLQFTAFTICMQTHGRVRQVFEFIDGDPEMIKVYKTKDGTYTTDADKGEFAKWAISTTAGVDPATGEPYKNADGSLQGEINYLIEPNEMYYIVDIYRAYVKLHELLTPYINELSQEACDTGMPVMRILALQWQDDKTVYNINDEYMFGEAFLVAPVLDEGYSRSIYLPEGNWKDLNTGEIYEVGAEGLWLTNYHVGLTQIPLFYNLDCESETAEELLPGMEEIFAYLGTIESGLPARFTSNT